MIICHSVVTLALNYLFYFLAFFLCALCLCVLKSRWNQKSTTKERHRAQNK